MKFKITLTNGDTGIFDAEKVPTPPPPARRSAFDRDEKKIHYRVFNYKSRIPGGKKPSTAGLTHRPDSSRWTLFVRGRVFPIQSVEEV